MTEIKSASDVLAFWKDAGPDKWYKKDETFDRAIRDDFLATYEAAAAGRLSSWESAPDSALALVIVLDQFPRNMFRGSPRAFAADERARNVAGAAISQGFDESVGKELRAFFYLPLMHSEDIEDQERCVELCRALGDENNLKYAELHADIIRRFGRFPHRNPVLNRDTTPEEQAFLESGGFAG
ncbi:DUF924 family protein [Pseudorhodoplanes sp.]|uniref:DUF924 family protein n=1 Tax=Pseudorhodoplanes sp. TaxID=1934341 RepID=UPI003D0E19D1